MTSVWNSENKTEEESQSSQAILQSATLLLKINQHVRVKFINLICLNTRLIKNKTVQRADPSFWSACEIVLEWKTETFLGSKILETLMWLSDNSSTISNNLVNKSGMKQSMPDKRSEESMKDDFIFSSTQFFY